MINFQQNRERIFNNFISEYSGATTNQQRKYIILNKLYKPLKQSQHIISNYRFILNKNNILTTTSNDYLQSYGRFTRFRYNRSGQFDLSLLDIKFDGLFNNNVTTIIKKPDMLVVGGLFISYNNITRNRISFFDNNFKLINNENISGFNGQIEKFVFDTTNKILCGGWFTTYNEQSYNRIIRLNMDGSIDSTFNIGTGFNGAVRDIVDFKNQIYVCGSFTTYNNQTRNRIIRLNQDGSIDNDFNIGTGINLVANTIGFDSNDKVYLGGTFTQYRGVGRNNIVRINQDGSNDATFNIGTGFNNTVHSLIVDNNDKIYVGGAFTTYNNQTRNYIIRLNTDGSIDNDFDIGTGFLGGQFPGIVRGMYLNNENKLYVVGQFVSYNGVSSNGLIKLNSDGSIDTLFDIGTGLQGNTGIGRVVFEYDDKVYVGGEFNSYNGIAENRMVVLDKNGNKYINPYTQEKFEEFIDENINPITTNFKEINEGLTELINKFTLLSPNNKSFALGTYLDYIAMKKDEIDYINNILPSYNEYFTNDELQILQKVGLKYFD